MKSNIRELRKRGYIDDLEISEYQLKSKEELIELLQDKEAFVRSAAAKTISIKFEMNDTELSKIILDKIIREKKLYVRIEMAAALEKGRELTAKEMIKFIRKIGNSQHKILPERPSKKKNFPLARDFMTRSLGRMNTCVMPVMMEVLHSEDKEKISEIFDSIGYMAFYNLQVAKSEYTDIILKTLEKYKDEEVIYWKGVQCLSGFPWIKTVQFLKSVIEGNRRQLFVEEAKRSLRLMKRPLLDEY